MAWCSSRFAKPLFGPGSVADRDTRCRKACTSESKTKAHKPICKARNVPSIKPHNLNILTLPRRLLIMTFMPIMWKRSTPRCADGWRVIGGRPIPMQKNGRLQCRLDVYWLLHNFVHLHFTTKQVPAVALGIVTEGLSVAELFRLHCAYP